MLPAFLSPDVARHIDFTGPGGCWLWKASLSAGYGQLTRDRRNWLAHRYVWFCATGSDPKGMHLHHECHVPACVNPAHLREIEPGAHTRHHLTTVEACHSGHPWTPENTYIRSSGQRQCRACKAATQRKRHAKNPQGYNQQRSERRRRSKDVHPPNT